MSVLVASVLYPVQLLLGCEEPKEPPRPWVDGASGKLRSCQPMAAEPNYMTTSTFDLQL